MQVKLLRVLQEREVRPVGASKPHVKVDVRMISASNRKLAENEVAAGRFREDLYYRLNVVGLTLPPLAERREDIALLAQPFHAPAWRSATPSRSTAFAPVRAGPAGTAAPWPGNVRQLQNMVEKCVVLCTGTLIPVTAGAKRASASQGSELRDAAWTRRARQFERGYLTQLLKMTNGNVAQAAKLARRNRTDFYALLARHETRIGQLQGLTPSHWRAAPRIAGPPAPGCRCTQTSPSHDLLEVFFPTPKAVGEYRQKGTGSDC
jgi:two-component system response regulator GlrR